MKYANSTLLLLKSMKAAYLMLVIQQYKMIKLTITMLMMMRVKGTIVMYILELIDFKVMLGNHEVAPGT